MKKTSRIPDPGEKIPMCFASDEIAWVLGGLVSITKANDQMIPWHICA